MTQANQRHEESPRRELHPATQVGPAYRHDTEPRRELIDRSHADWQRGIREKLLLRTERDWQSPHP